MSAPSWTPGPWKIDFGHPHGLPGGVSQASGKPVTRFNSFARPTTTEALANARLIAAAPDLVEALQAMVAEKADYMALNNLGDPEAQHSIRLARAALAKAGAL